MSFRLQTISLFLCDFNFVLFLVGISNINHTNITCDMSHPHTDSFNDEKSFRRSADYNCELHVDMFLLHFMKY